MAIGASVLRPALARRHFPLDIESRRARDGGSWIHEVELPGGDSVLLEESRFQSFRLLDLDEQQLTLDETLLLLDRLAALGVGIPDGEVRRLLRDVVGAQSDWPSNCGGTLLPSRRIIGVLYPCWPVLAAVVLIGWALWPLRVSASVILPILVGSAIVWLRLCADYDDVRRNWIWVKDGEVTVSSVLSTPEQVTFEVAEVRSAAWLFGSGWTSNISPSAQRSSWLQLTTYDGATHEVELLFPHNRARWAALRQLGRSFPDAEWDAGGHAWDPRSAPLGPKGLRRMSVWGRLPTRT